MNGRSVHSNPRGRKVKINNGFSRYFKPRNVFGKGQFRKKHTHELTFEKYVVEWNELLDNLPMSLGSTAKLHFPSIGPQETLVWFFCIKKKKSQKIPAHELIVQSVLKLWDQSLGWVHICYLP